jgi:hypothetical protein
MKTITFKHEGIDWKNRLVLWHNDNAYKIVKCLCHRVCGEIVWTLNIEEY